MQAQKIIISNFRSFGQEPTHINLSQGLTGLIGANSSGKTAVMAAFTRMFGLTNFDRTFVKSDFHAPPVAYGQKRPMEINLSLEVVFTFTGGEGAIPELFDDMTVTTPGVDPILRVRLSATWTDDGISPDGSVEHRIECITVPEGEDEFQNTTSFVARKRALIQAFYVPAIRKPSEQMRFSAGAILHRLYNRMARPEKFDEEFSQLIDQVDEKANSIPKFKRIQDTLTKEWQSYNRDAKYNEARVAFASQNFESFLSKLEVEFSPSDLDRPYGIRELGEGYRSLFYMTLVSTLLKIEADQDEPNENGLIKPYLTVLLTEEPENHVSPQLLGVVLNNLHTLAILNNAQVVISSHTPSIVKRIDPENIRHLRIDSDSHQSVVSEIVLPDKEDEAFKYVKEAVRNYPELYFAKLAVLGEGDSEEVVFSALARAYGTHFDSHYITVAPLGGRFVNHIWRLLENLGIPYVTLLDLDRERGTGGWERVKYGIIQLIKHKPKISKKLLAVEGGLLNKKELAEMHKWDTLELDSMRGWIEALEEYNLFLSSPLDLDFMMYESFPVQYQGTVPSTGGPVIPSAEEDFEGYQEKLLSGIQATLKSKTATADTYSDDQKAAMIWYNYLFLGRGKPSTHIKALSSIDPDQLKKDAPKVLLRMFDRIDEIIKAGKAQ